LRIPFTAPQGGYDRVQIGLRGQSRQGRKRRVYDIHARLARHQQGSLAVSRRVVGVQVDGNAQFFLERLYQFVGGKWLEESSHVLDGQDMGAHFLQFPGKGDIVFQGVLVSLGIAYVTGVANGCLAYLAGFQNGVHGDPHAFGPVKGVKDPEDIDPGFGRGCHETLHHVVRIVGIAYGIGTAQQHLEQDIRCRFPQLVETLPGALLEEAHGDVEGCASPHLQGEKVGAQAGCGFGNLEQVECPDTGRQQGLVGVAHGCVGDQYALLIQYPLFQSFGAPFPKDLGRPGRSGQGMVDLGGPGIQQVGGAQRSGNARRAVYNHGTEEIKDLRRPVLLLPHLHQLGMLVDKRCVTFPGQKDRMGNHVFQERDIGIDPPYAELL